MARLVGGVALRRPDALTVWEDPEVQKRLYWYRQVMTGAIPAKFMLCRKVPAGLGLTEATEEELWAKHGELSGVVSSMVTDVANGSKDFWGLKDYRPNFLDLKAELVNRLLHRCNFCEWNCKVDRAEGKIGFCRLDQTTSVDSYFHHYGEEAPLIGVEQQGGSGTIFFESCNAHCVFCIHPETYILTQNGPASVHHLYDTSGPEITMEDGFARFPNGLYTFAADGRPIKISKIFKHEYKGPMVVVKPLYAPAIITTPDHEILAAEGLGHSLEKMPAGKLSVGHWVAIPRSKYPETADILDVARIIEPVARSLSYTHGQSRLRLPKMRQVIALTNSGLTSFEIADRLGYHPARVRNLRSKIRREGFPKATRENRPLIEQGKVRLKNERKPGIPARIGIDEKLAEFLGYFCAEGYVTKHASRPSSFHVVLTFGRHERKLVERTRRLLRELFDIRPYVVERRTAIAVEITKTSLALLLDRLCGTGAKSKKVPAFLYEAPESVVEAFLHAYEAGDGCITGGNLSMNTVSRNLAVGLYGLYLKLGHLPGFYVDRRPTHTSIEGRKVKQSILYYVKVRFRPMKEHSWQVAKHVRYSYADDQILVPIFRVGRAHHTGPVYNIEVEDPEHAYTANYIAIGNCQNWSISQPKTKASITGQVVTPVRLAAIADELANGGAANINYVGGEPTVDLHTIINSLPHMKRSIPLIWNSNMYCSMETMKILADVIDLWLPDFKFWRDECARRLMCVGAKASYPGVAKRNHRFAADHGSMIIRHLVMPGHVECCTKPILRFIAETIGGKVFVNVMGQYYPANMVTKNPEKYSDIARYPSRGELAEAYEYARGLGLQFQQVS